jgi:hypothetical protein
MHIGFVGKPECKRALGKPRRRWEDNIKMGLREIRWGDMNWIHLAQGSIKCWEIVEQLRDWPIHKKDQAPWTKLVS